MYSVPAITVRPLDSGGYELRMDLSGDLSLLFDPENGLRFWHKGEYQPYVDALGHSHVETFRHASDYKALHRFLDVAMRLN